MKAEAMTLYCGATRGAEAEFGRLAEQFGIEEVNYSFEGHSNERTRGLHVLGREELITGDVSLQYVSRLLNRNYTQKGDIFRKVLQTLFHIVNRSREVFVIGEVQEDLTVRGGTGWGAEFAKLCNKTLHTFDQAQDTWLRWGGESWQRVENPVIEETLFAGIGTRFLQDSGKQAIERLFKATLG